MARRFYHLPSLTSLNSFDACARRGSFTGAASELGVTLGAVSRQVKTLEAELDCLLFRRLHRGVELTAEGQDLFAVVTAGFQSIGEVCQTLKTRSAGADVTVSATTAFASLWLMPRLADFWQQYADVALNHSISDNPNDPGFVNSDIRIRYGDGVWRGEQSQKLFDDVIYPVCGRDFAKQHKIERIEQLLQLPLIQLDSIDPAWTDWNTWLARSNCVTQQLKFRHFNNYVVALQAAEENQGAVLGWHSLVSPLIESRRLTRLGNFEIRAPGSYYLSWDSARSLNSGAEQLRHWLLAVCGNPDPV